MMTTTTMMRVVDSRLLRLTVLLLCLDLMTITRCQKDYTIVSSCYDNSTSTPICFAAYKYREVALLPWSNASALCRSVFNASLPVIGSAHIQTRLEEFLWSNNLTFLTDSIWIGFQGRSNGNTWRWVNGDAYTGPPLEYDSGGFQASFAAITRYHGQPALQATYASSVDGYICEYPQPSYCVGTTRPTYTPSPGGRCFVLYDEGVNWFMARQKCRLGNGDLARIEYASLNETLNELDYQDQANGAKRYFAGLRKMWFTTEQGSVELQETYFQEKATVENDTRADLNCISVDYKQQWAWSIRSCDIHFHTICQTSGPMTIPLWTTAAPDSSAANASQSLVSLPAWLVGLICGLAGLVYIVSILVVALIVYKCSRGKDTESSQDITDERSGNQYTPNPHEQQGGRGGGRAANPPRIPDAHDLDRSRKRDYDPEFDDEYEGLEDDGTYEDTVIPSNNTQEYANHHQVAINGRGRKTMMQ